MRLLHQYWAWAGSNIGAMPAETVITVLATLLFRKPIARLIGWIRREHGEALHQAVKEARLARQIAADTYRAHTGEDHPAAPREE